MRKLTFYTKPRKWRCSSHAHVCVECGRSAHTKEQALLAREANITMFAVGVGRAVSDRELKNIAGSEDRVITVTSYEDLQKIKELLAYKTCVCESLPSPCYLCLL